MLHSGKVVNVRPIQGCHEVTILYKNGRRKIQFAHNHPDDPSKNLKSYEAAEAWLDEPAQLKHDLSKSMQSNIDAELLRRQRNKLMPTVKNQIGLEFHKRKAAKKKAIKKEQKELRDMVNTITSSDPWSSYKSKKQRKAEIIADNKKFEEQYPSSNPWGDYTSKKDRKAKKIADAHKKDFDNQLHSDARDQLINKDLPPLAPNATKKQITDAIDYLFKLKFKRDPEYTNSRFLRQKEVMRLVMGIVNDPKTRKDYKRYIKRDFDNDD